MPLINFGAILGFAEEIESRTLAFFSDAAEAAGAEAASPFEALKENSAKRLKEIRRIRRENVTEMILESIEGFRRDPFTLEEQEDAKPMGSGERKLAGAALLDRSVRYYTEAAVKLKGQSEVSRALKTLAKKAGRDLDTL